MFVLGRGKSSLTHGAVDILSNISSPMCSLNLQILELARFQCDSTVQSQLSLDFCSQNSLYEIILTDGSYKLKGLLHPKDTSMALQGRLLPSTVIQVTRWTHYPIVKSYDNEPIPYLVIETLEVVLDALPEVNVSVLASLQWKEYSRLLVKLKKESHLLETQRKERLEELLKDLDTRPFVGGRGCYLHLLCDDCPLGPQWEPKDLSLEAPNLSAIFSDSVEQLVRLSDLSETFTAHQGKKQAEWEAKKAQASENADSSTLTPPRVSMFMGSRFIVVRVLAKTRLTYYGNSATDERWPFKFALRVVDVSGIEINVDFWSVLCPAVYYGLRPGQIVKLSALRLRDLYSGFPSSIVSLLNSAELNPTFEITVNPRGGNKSACTILKGPMADWFNEKLPFASASFFVEQLASQFNLTRATSQESVQALADALARHSLTVPLYNVAGTVFWLGPIESRRVHGFTILTRWILLLGLTNLRKHMLIQLAANSDVEALDFLRKNDKVHLTHLRAEVHHSHLVGVASIYSTIRTVNDWTQIPGLLVPEANTWKSDSSDAQPHPPQDWPLTLKCIQTEEYDKLYGALLYTQPPRQMDFLPRNRKDLVQAGPIAYTTWITSEKYAPNITGWLSAKEVGDIINLRGTKQFQSETARASFLWVALETKRDAKVPLEYYCAVLPITAAHLCSGSMVDFTARIRKPNFLQSLAREFSLKTKGNVLFGSCVFRIDNEVRHVITNIWRDLPKYRNGFKTPEDIGK